MHPQALHYAPHAYSTHVQTQALPTTPSILFPRILSLLPGPDVWPAPSRLQILYTAKNCVFYAHLLSSPPCFTFAFVLHLNFLPRHTRPGWSTLQLVALGCVWLRRTDGWGPYRQPTASSIGLPALEKRGSTVVHVCMLLAGRFTLSAVREVHAVQAESQLAAGRAAVAQRQRLNCQRAAAKKGGEGGQAAVGRGLEPALVVGDTCTRAAGGGQLGQQQRGAAEADRTSLVVVGSRRQGGRQTNAELATSGSSPGMTVSALPCLSSAPDALRSAICKRAASSTAAWPRNPRNPRNGLTHAAEPAEVQTAARAHQLHRRLRPRLAVRRPVGHHKVEQQVCDTDGKAVEPGPGGADAEGRLVKLSSAARAAVSGTCAPMLACPVASARQARDSLPGLTVTVEHLIHKGPRRGNGVGEVEREEGVGVHEGGARQDDVIRALRAADERR